MTDNVINLNLYRLDKIEEATKQCRIAELSGALCVADVANDMLIETIEKHIKKIDIFDEYQLLKLEMIKARLRAINLELDIIKSLLRKET